MRTAVRAAKTKYGTIRFGHDLTERAARKKVMNASRSRPKQKQELDEEVVDTDDMTQRHPSPQKVPTKSKTKSRTK